MFCFGKAFYERWWKGVNMVCSSGLMARIIGGNLGGVLQMTDLGFDVYWTGDHVS